MIEKKSHANASQSNHTDYAEEEYPSIGQLSTYHAPLVNVKVVRETATAAFSSELFSFHAEHSTTQVQPARVQYDYAVECNNCERVVAVFLVMEKAFYRVWHAGLLYKLSTSTTRVVKIVTE